MAKLDDVAAIARRALMAQARRRLVTNSGGPPAGTFESTSPEA
jgi:hypothetical protein